MTHRANRATCLEKEESNHLRHRKPQMARGFEGSTHPGPSSVEVPGGNLGMLVLPKGRAGFA